MFPEQSPEKFLLIYSVVLEVQEGFDSITSQMGVECLVSFLQTPLLGLTPGSLLTWIQGENNSHME